MISTKPRHITNGILLIICIITVSFSANAQTLAFPTAEGFGKFTTGGRGGTLYIVSNLNDSGSGSLREAVEASGKRVVVFSISGIIQLQSQLTVSNNDLTILGQTAPGDGICIANFTFQISASNIIIRYMRFRPGSYQNTEYDASWGRNNSDIILDHCSFSWGNDEQASFYDNANFTMQYCIISESLYASTHPKGNHGYGGIWGGMGATFHHNLIANHTSRLPRFCGARYHLTTASSEIVDYRNNVIFNWGFNSSYGGEAGNYNMVNNYYKPGPATSSGTIPYRIINPSDTKADGNPISTWYLSGNYVEGNTSVSADNWNGGVQQSDASITESELKRSSPLSVIDIHTETAQQAFNSVLASAGASLVRDAVDQRAVDGATTGVTNYGGVYGANKGIIDNENQVGGYPTYNTYNTITDTDHDGMDDLWEALNGLSVGTKDDAGDANGDGYTNIEAYANALLDASNGGDKTLIPADNAINVSNDMQFKLHFDSAPILQSSGKISLYKSNGILVETIDLSQMPSGVPMSATWPWIESLNGSDIRVIPVIVDENTAYISFSDGAMDYNTEYYITIDKSIFSNASSIGFNGIAANNWSFTTRSQPAADLNYTVAADGTGDFASLQGALNFLPSGASNAKIYIENGTYIGLAFMKNKSSYTIEGESKNGVLIKGFNNSNLNASTHWRPVVNLYGDDINLIGITIINTTPNGGTQAEALKLSGNRCVVVNCEFYSYQDTVLIEGKVYFKACLLEGDVDFIWGTGTVFFQSCELRANDNGGYNVMARNDNTKHGYAFADCNLTRTSSSTTTQYLGRDANTGYPYAEIVYLNCTMGNQVPSVGWLIRNEMDGSLLTFAEYRSVDESGNLINTSLRHSKSRQLTAADNTLYRNLDWFFNGWTPVVPDYTNTDPATCVYEFAGSDDTWTIADNWNPRVPTNKDTAIIRNGEVKIYDNISALVRVEPNGIFRMIGNYSVPNLELQGGTIKVYTSNTTYGLTSNIEVQQASTIWTGSQTTSVFWLQGSLHGSGDLTKTYTGILDLSIDATDFSGNWFINEGTFRIANSQSIGDNTVTISNGASIDIASANVYIYNIILGSGIMKLNNNLEVKKCSINGVALEPGTYTTSDYPLSITGSGTLTVLGNPDCAGVEDGTAYLDYCTVCVGGTTGLEACEQIFAEAENISCSFEGVFEDKNIGFSGTGYVNGDNAAGTTVSFNMYANAATTVSFGIQYANGGTTDRPCRILVNGTEAIASFSMPVTSWTDYQSSETELNIEAGINEITFVALSADGFANLDFYYLYGNASFAGCQTTQSIDLIAGWNFVSTYLLTNDMSIAALFPNATEAKTMNQYYNNSHADYLNTLTAIEPGVGYLVYNSINETIDIPGVEMRLTLSLHNGLNLVGCPYSATSTFETIFGADLPHIQIIKSFDGIWEQGGTQTIETLEPGKAYFILK